MSSYWPSLGGHVISISQGLLSLLWGMSPRCPAAWSCVTWGREAGHEAEPRPMVMQGAVIMTSYQELTAAGENSPLFAGCCRAKKVINRDLSGGTPPGVCSVEHKVKGKVCPGFHSVNPPATLPSSSSDNPPPLAPEGLCTTACLHSPRVPWRNKAQRQGSGRRTSAPSETRPESEFGTHLEHIQLPNGSEAHITEESLTNSYTTKVDERNKTFEWMNVKRSQHRAGKFCKKIYPFKQGEINLYDFNCAWNFIYFSSKTFLKLFSHSKVVSELE